MMEEGSAEGALRDKRRIASHARDADFAPFARALLYKLGYAVIPAEELAEPQLRIVREDRLAEVAKLPPLPIILLTDRRQPESGDARVIGAVRRPAGVPPLYRLLQSALEEHPRSVPRLPVTLRARATSSVHAFDLEVRSISENGCLLAGPKLPLLDTAVDLAIELPWGEKVQVTAVVSYEQSGNVGALFQGMTLAARRRIAKQVARLLDTL
jgi:hypothetical protein